MFQKKKASEIELTQPGIYLVRVDSAIAHDWLKLNTGNRRIRKSLVDYLSAQIVTNQYRSDHPQAIVFSKSKRLIDGQHRLTAISKADVFGQAAPMLRVETGAEDSIRDYLDSGIPRTLEDRVQLDENHLLNRFASQMVSFLFMMHQTSCKRPTPDDARSFFSTHGKALRMVFKIRRKEMGTGQISVCYAAMQYFEKDEAKADEFYCGLFKPAGDIQQAQMLRDFLIRHVGEANGMSFRNECYEKAVYCMKAHKEGRHVSRVLRCQSW